MTTNVIGVVKNGSDTHYPSISVVKQSEEDASEKIFSAAPIIDGLHDIAGFDIRVMEVVLMREAPHSIEPRITNSDRIGDCSPPFISSGSIKKYDQVSPSPICRALSNSKKLALALSRVADDHLRVSRRRKIVL
jgi:hypothetical protein